MPLLTLKVLHLVGDKQKLDTHISTSDNDKTKFCAAHCPKETFIGYKQAESYSYFQTTLMALY